MPQWRCPPFIVSFTYFCRKQYAYSFKTVFLKNLPCRVLSAEARPEYLQKSATLSHQFSTPASVLVERLSFSHIRELLTIDDPVIRFFYETECIRRTWSVRELRRQISTNLHVRVGISADKDKLISTLNQSAEHDSLANQIRQPKQIFLCPKHL